MFVKRKFYEKQWRAEHEPPHAFDFMSLRHSQKKIKCYLKKFSPRGAKQFLQSRFSSRLGDRPPAYFVYGKGAWRRIGGKMPAKTDLGEAIHCY